MERIGPDPDARLPLSGYGRLCFLKNIVRNPRIVVGDYTYYDDFEDVANFEKNVKYHFDFVGDRLVIGRFCMIASGATFLMNGANHLSRAVSAYPFAIFGRGWEGAMEGREYPRKGDLVIGNDVWIGCNATLMAGITVGDGAIIAANATVVRDVPPYAVVGGNPAETIRMRFGPAAVDALLAARWWDWEPGKITRNLRALTGGDPEAVARCR